VSGVGRSALDIQRYLLFPENNSDGPLCMAWAARKLLWGLSYRVRTTWFNFTGVSRVSPAVTRVWCVISWSALWSKFEAHAKLRPVIWLAHDTEWRWHNTCLSTEAISLVYLHTYVLVWEQWRADLPSLQSLQEYDYRLENLYCSVNIVRIF
jgi:hypothetical protein